MRVQPGRNHRGDTRVTSAARCSDATCKPRREAFSMGFSEGSGDGLPKVLSKPSTRTILPGIAYPARVAEWFS